MRIVWINSLVAVVFACVCGISGANAEPTRTESIVAERQVGGQAAQSERDEQEALFNYYFRDQNLKYKMKLSDLSTEATVPNWRIPYSAGIHPETGGGLSSGGGGGIVRSGGIRSGGIRGGIRGGVRAAPRPGGFLARLRPTGPGGGDSSALTTYDRAFNGGTNLANAYELKRLMGTQQRALFPARRMRSNSESWEGYCSGFTGSTIKHPEPVKAVDAGACGGTSGVTLQPSEIKALLTCIYNRTTPDSYLYLAPPTASDGGPNMGSFHLTLANYVSHAGHPVGMDRTKGQVAWNNPVYQYKVNSLRDAGTEGEYQYKDVETTVTYTYYGTDSQRQTDLESGDRVGQRKQSMTLRYRLALDKRGEIVGGRATSFSGHFLWIPLYPVQATPDGSVPGNPHVDVKTVIALARASAMPDVQQKFDKGTIGPRVGPVSESE
jgi:hypothetical protein